MTEFLYILSNVAFLFFFSTFVIGAFIPVVGDFFVGLYNKIRLTWGRKKDENGF